MWKEGRQETGYFKCKLAGGRRWDCYLLKYPVGSYLPDHIDPVDVGREHHRINVVLKRAERGGNFYISQHPRFADLSKKRIIKFRSDIYRHGLTPVIKGTRYVLSIGWIKDI